PLTRPYGMPDPSVVDKKKIPETHLPVTYLYDIPTVAGQEIDLLGTSSSIEEVAVSGSVADSHRYDILGRPVSDTYKGIVITRGQKYIAR
ncbi:MAG: hypothetical protein K2H87_07130, partial [Duncaniella sp.]|nr:hypothetical protein [Duncaniella sp.]